MEDAVLYSYPTYSIHRIGFTSPRVPHTFVGALLRIVRGLQVVPANYFHNWTYHFSTVGKQVFFSDICICHPVTRALNVLIIQRPRTDRFITHIDNSLHSAFCYGAVRVNQAINNCMCGPSGMVADCLAHATTHSGRLSSNPWSKRSPTSGQHISTGRTSSETNKKMGGNLWRDNASEDWVGELGISEQCGSRKGGLGQAICSYIRSDTDASRQRDHQRRDASPSHVLHTSLEKAADHHTQTPYSQNVQQFPSITRLRGQTACL